MTASTSATTGTTTATIITPATCGYTHLPALAASDVWSVEAHMKSILAPCEVWEEKGVYYFSTFHGEISRPFESELLACQCAAIMRNPNLQFAPRPKKTDWQTRALWYDVREVLEGDVAVV